MSYRPSSRDLDPINKVASGVRGSIKLPVGITFQQIQLVTNINDAAKIAKVEIELNGDIIQSLTGTQIKMIETYKGHEAETGRYVLAFASLEARNLGGTLSSALVTMPRDSLIMYVTFGDLSGVTNPSLNARALVLPTTRPRQFIPRIYETVAQLPVAGKNPVRWPSDPRKAIKRLHMLPDSGSLTRLDIVRDNFKEFEAATSDINFDLIHMGSTFCKRVPQAGYLHFDPTLHGYVEKSLFPTLARESLKFEIHGDTAGQAVTILVEELEAVPQPAQA